MNVNLATKCKGPWKRQRGDVNYSFACKCTSQERQVGARQGWVGGGVYCHMLLYVGYIGMCHCEGYGFQAVYSGIGYINQRV